MRPVILTILLTLCVSAYSQSAEQEAKAKERLERYFTHYKPKGQTWAEAARLLDIQTDYAQKTMIITADETFAAQDFTTKNTTQIYKRIKEELPKPYNAYQLKVITNGMAIEDLIPNRLSEDVEKSRMWGDIDYRGEPWVKNTSLPYKVTHGLQNRHLSLWASHGNYYDQAKGYWKWQRPRLFGTTEDLYTQTIVVPYLIPMLENAGAIVFSPRERDWQKNEVIVDNDDRNRGTSYIEVNRSRVWVKTGIRGFAKHIGTYRDAENPFTAGSCMKANCTSSKSDPSMISYQPNLPEAGRYAVYVSYQTLDKSIDDAHYIVWHKGEKTEFRVNQRMGGGTWVYLGTFDFDEGSSEFNRVVITNESRRGGVVTSDAVRFGGGMGNIQRGGTTSGYPRCLEGARYYAQWAGMPYHIYSSKNGMDDYADDINVRSAMTNYLAGGSCYVPTLDGLRVPLELSLAVHSDAGFTRDGSLVGSLSICTTDFNDGRLNTGISRMASRDFADALLNNAWLDIRYQYKTWVKRERYDRNYSETRLPEVPSAIFETLSHQNFPDMLFGQDPNFRFTLARSVYKTILRYVNDMHGTNFVVQPLAPDHFQIEFTDKQGEIRLSWTPVDDPQETTAKPTGYILYTATGHSDFDNGKLLRQSATSHTMKLEPNVLYSFRIAAVNRGGKSFPTETLTALYNPEAEKTVLIVNGFHRLSSPAVRNTTTEQGFDLDEDPGVTYGATAGWAGRQLTFSRTHQGGESEASLGWSGTELAGKFIAGNDFNYTKTHAKAIGTSGLYNIASCSKEAVEDGRVTLDRYAAVDLLLGLEKNDGHSLKPYKTFPLSLRSILSRYTSHGGALLVSGAYIGSDMREEEEQRFLADVLKCQYTDTYREVNDSVLGMGTELLFHHQLNESHYAAVNPDVLEPVEPAYTALQYADSTSAAVAYKGDDYRAMTLAFPFECIRTEQKQAAIMRAILRYLLE